MSHVCKDPDRQLWSARATALTGELWERAVQHGPRWAKNLDDPLAYEQLVILYFSLLDALGPQEDMTLPPELVPYGPDPRHLVPSGSIAVDASQLSADLALSRSAPSHGHEVRQGWMRTCTGNGPPCDIADELFKRVREALEA